MNSRNLCLVHHEWIKLSFLIKSQLFGDVSIKLQRICCQFYQLFQLVKNLSISSSLPVKIRLATTCHSQTCYKLLKQLAVKLLTASLPLEPREPNVVTTV